MHSHLQGHPALIHAIKRLEQLNPDQFEIYYERRASTKVDSKDQVIDTLARFEDVGIAVRLVKDHKLGFSYTTSLENQAIDQAVHTAFEMANFMPEDPLVSLHSFGNYVYPNVDNWDSQGLQVPLSRKIEMAQALESYCRKADPRITTVRSASLSETSFEVHLVDSNGEHIHHKSTGYTASLTCKAESNGDSQMGSEFSFSNYLDSLPIEKTARQAADLALELLGAGNPPTMKCPAILRNAVVADLLDFLSASFSAEQMDKGRSMLVNRLGQLTFADSVTLINDGLLPGGMGTSPFDGEGIPANKTVLVDGGFISGALYDGYYARKKGAASTASAVRGIKSPPSIGCSNFYMKSGRKSLDSLIKGLSKGILITDLMGIHTANPVTGDFSLGASGILIENGKLGQPVGGFAVAGNVLELLRKITDVASDLKFFGKIGAPSIRLTELSVGGA